MKRYSYLLLLPLLLVVAACSGSKADLSTPEKAFASMVQAIHAKDLDTYKACWHESKADKEGLVSQLNSADKDKVWNTLALSCPRDASVVDPTTTKDGDVPVTVLEVVVPGVENGAVIRAVALTQVGSDWKMWHW